MRFRRSGDGVTVTVRAGEAALLASAAEQLLGLLGPPQDAADDPLAAMVGLPSGEVRRPDDPALARLLPDAYRPDATDDPRFDVGEAASDFRRFTEGDLREAKRAQARAVLRHLGGVEGRGKLQLDRDGADDWLGTLNDLRLVLGTRLEVTEQGRSARTIDDEAAAWSLQVYDWLGSLQASLLDSLPPRPAQGAG